MLLTKVRNYILDSAEGNLDNLPPSIQAILDEFKDMFPDELPLGLPPYRGIEHQIDLIPGASLPNRPAYKTNPMEIQEIEKQVQDRKSTRLNSSHRSLSSMPSSA